MVGRTSSWFGALAALTAVSLVFSVVHAPPRIAKAALTPAATVTGMARDAAGAPVADVLVSVELLPSGGYRSPDGALAHAVASGTADAAGVFAITVPVTDAVRQEAAFNNGVLNFYVSAVKEPRGPHLFVPSTRTSAWPPTGTALTATLDVEATCTNLLAPMMGAKPAAHCAALGASVDLANDCIAGNSVTAGHASTSSAAVTPTAGVTEWLETLGALGDLAAGLDGGTAPGVELLAVDLATVEAFVANTTSDVRDRAADYLSRFDVGAVDTAALLATVRAYVDDNLGRVPSVDEARTSVEGLRQWVAAAVPPVDPSAWLTGTKVLQDLLDRVGSLPDEPPAELTVDVSWVEATVYRTYDEQVQPFLDSVGMYQLDVDTALRVVRSRVDGVVDEAPSVEELRAALDALQQMVWTVPPAVDAALAGPLATANALAQYAGALATGTTDLLTARALEEAGVTRDRVIELISAVMRAGQDEVTRITTALGQVDLQRDVQTVRILVDEAVASVDPQTRVDQFIDAANDTAAFVRAYVLGLLPAPVATDGVQSQIRAGCATLWDAATKLSRFVVGCLGGAAVGLASTEVAFKEFEPTCQQLGTGVRAIIDAAVAFLVACAESRDPTCNAAKRTILDAAAAAGAMAQACVEGRAIPLAPVPVDATIIADTPTYVSCAELVGKITAAAEAVKQTALQCLDGTSGACKDAKADADAKAAELKACVTWINPTAGAALPGPSAVQCRYQFKPMADSEGMTADDLVDRAIIAGGVFWSRMKEQDNTAAGLAIQPVNIGVLMLSELPADVEHPGVPETPPDEPTDQSTGDTTTPLVDTDTGTHKTIVEDPTVFEPMVSEPDSGEVQQKVPTSSSLPPILPEYPPRPRPEKEDPPTPDSRCQYPKNWDTWIIDVEEKGTFSEPVGEVHSSTDEWVDYTYQEKAKTTLGIKIQPEYKGWKGGGSARMENEGSWSVNLPKTKGPFSRLVMGDFRFDREWMTRCPYGWDKHSPPPYHQMRIRPLHWTGGLRYDGRDIGSRDDTKENFDKAWKDLRVGVAGPRQTMERKKGKSFKYGFSAQAFGIEVTAESELDTSHKLTIWTGETRQKYHFWGDRGTPSRTENRAIYAYW